MFNDFAKDKLNWLPQSGIGYYPVTDAPYDQNYFNKYVEMAKTDIGIKLNKARVDLVNKYTNKDVLDIGIGAGTFVASRPNTYGHDINIHGVNWLIEQGKYRSPVKGANSLTFWDSLEHIHDPSIQLNGAKEYVFVSCPIYEDVEHVLRSKHFRPDEHCWYWTEEGLKIFMMMYGFVCIEHNQMESEIGREDIGTFVFKRI